MAEPARIERSLGEHSQRRDHEDRLVGVVHAGQAEGDIVEPPAQGDQQYRRERGPRSATLRDQVPVHFR